MTDRPMLMSAPMVRAILNGTKTQTRRALRAKPPADIVDFCTFHNPDGEGLAHFGFDPVKRELQGWFAVCPYGQVGDRLWVREAWMPDPPCDGTWGYTAWAGNRIGRIAAVPERFQHPAFCNYSASWPHADDLRWTPSIHMPRWASRITLEITDVRVERLQDISEADAMAEGIVATRGGFGLPDGSHFHTIDPRESYWSLWEAINGPGSVDANPWVWCVSFSPIEMKGKTP